MDSVYVYLSIFVMAAVSYLIRSLPMTLIKKPIQSTFIQSFLFYVPYVTLAVMTFPAILRAPQNQIAGLAALVVGVVAAWRRASLFRVAVYCCLTVLVLETVVAFL